MLGKVSFTPGAGTKRMRRSARLEGEVVRWGWMMMAMAQRAGRRSEQYVMRHSKLINVMQICTIVQPYLTFLTTHPEVLYCCGAGGLLCLDRAFFRLAFPSLTSYNITRVIYIPRPVDWSGARLALACLYFDDITCHRFERREIQCGI